MTRLLEAIFSGQDEEVLVWVDDQPWVSLAGACAVLGYNYRNVKSTLTGKKNDRLKRRPMELRKIRLLRRDGGRAKMTALHARDFLYFLLIYEPKPGGVAERLQPLIDEFRDRAMDALWRGEFAPALRAIPLDGAPR